MRMAFWSAEEKMNYEVIHAPDGQKNVLYKVLRMCFKALNLKKLLVGTKEEVLARAAKMNARNPFVLPADKNLFCFVLCCSAIPIVMIESGFYTINPFFSV